MKRNFTMRQFREFKEFSTRHGFCFANTLEFWSAINTYFD